MWVQGYILRRVLQAIVVWFLVSLILYALISAAPGDPISAMISSDPLQVQQFTDKTSLARQRELLGLDKPWIVRYGLWVYQLFHGDLGFSFVTRRPVAQTIFSHIWPTLLLMGTGTVLAIAIGVPLGIVSALRQYTLLDHILGLASFIVVSVPGFFLAIVFLYLFASRLDLFPSFGMSSLADSDTLPPALDVAWHMTLPVSVLAMQRIGSYLRYTRSSMQEILRADYLRTAYAKGLTQRLVVLHHMLPNALVPLVTLVGLSLPFLFSGAVMIEIVFAWPGLGYLGFKSIGQRDYPVIMGFNLMIAALVLSFNLVTDVVCAVIDPRIRLR